MHVQLYIPAMHEYIAHAWQAIGVLHTCLPLPNTSMRDLKKTAHRGSHAAGDMLLNYQYQSPSLFNFLHFHHNLIKVLLQANGDGVKK